MISMEGCEGQLELVDAVLSSKVRMLGVADSTRQTQDPRRTRRSSIMRMFMANA